MHAESIVEQMSLRVASHVGVPLLEYLAVGEGLLAELSRSGALGRGGFGAGDHAGETDVSAAHERASLTGRARRGCSPRHDDFRPLGGHYHAHRLRWRGSRLLRRPGGNGWFG